MLDRPRLWRLTAGLAGLLFVTVLAIAAQGSLRILQQPPHGAAARRADTRTWLTWCSRGRVRFDRTHLAYCARVEGIVFDVTHGPDPDEEHLGVISDFHVVVVHVVRAGGVPGFGSRIIAIGPLVRARNGQREIQAFSLRPA